MLLQGSQLEKESAKELKRTEFSLGQKKNFIKEVKRRPRLPVDILLTHTPYGGPHTIYSSCPLLFASPHCVLMMNYYLQQQHLFATKHVACRQFILFLLSLCVPTTIIGFHLSSVTVAAATAPVTAAVTNK